jgi:hypothetical protein
MASTLSKIEKDLDMSMSNEPNKILHPSPAVFGLSLMALARLSGQQQEQKNPIIYHHSYCGPRCGLGFVLRDAGDLLLVQFTAHASDLAHPEYRLVSRSDCHPITRALAAALLRFPSMPSEKNDRLPAWYGSDVQGKHFRAVQKWGSTEKQRVNVAREDEEGGDKQYPPASVRVRQDADGQWYRLKDGVPVGLDASVLFEPNARMRSLPWRNRNVIVAAAPRNEALLAVERLRDAALTFEDRGTDMDRLAAARLRSVLAGVTAERFREAVGISRRQLDRLDQHISTVYAGSLYPRNENAVLLSGRWDGDAGALLGREATPEVRKRKQDEVN